MALPQADSRGSGSATGLAAQGAGCGPPSQHSRHTLGDWDSPAPWRGWVRVPVKGLGGVQAVLAQHRVWGPQRLGVTPSNNPQLLGFGQSHLRPSLVKYRNKNATSLSHCAWHGVRLSHGAAVITHACLSSSMPGPLCTDRAASAGTPVLVDKTSTAAVRSKDACRVTGY